jgi:flagellar basal-body rod modification protein FlgD
MIPSLSAMSTTQQTATGSSAASSSDPVNALASESTFLQLLVAQLQNQDPESPQDGTQFVAQLAQFSSLEQQMEMRQDLDTINTNVADIGSATASSSASSSGSSSGASGTGSSSGS